MTNTKRLQDIANIFGPLISKVAKEVSYEFSAQFGRHAYGYVVASAEDIEQRVWLKLAEDGTTVDQFLDKNEPQASVRLYARNAANREVESRHRKGDGSGLGHRERSADFSPAALNWSNGEKDTYSDPLRVNRRPTTMGIPSADMLREELETRLQDLAEDLLSKLSGTRREALALWVLEGRDAASIADAIGTTYGQARNLVSEGQKALHPEEVASLRGIRAYSFPDAKRPKPIEAMPTALLDLLAT